MHIAYRYCILHIAYCGINDAASEIHIGQIYVCVGTMDLSNPPDDSKIALLTIPRSDLQTESSLASPAPSKPMILLQLPPRWSVSDLQSAHFVASTPSQHLACVVESKHCSFTVHNVETSNTLVMLPHPKSLQREAIHETKRCKVTELGKTLTVLPAHLLTKGGSGASFLELRVKTLNYVDLLSALDGCVLNPYSTASGEADDPDSQMSSTSDLSTSPMTTNSSATIETVGRSILDLAASLQCSKHEIEKGLRMIQAYALPRTDPSQYCLISDEAFQECNSTIVSTLAEAEGCDDYAGTGITINDFVKEAMERMNENDRFDDVDSVIRHCLQLLRIKSHTSSSNCYRDTQIIQLDVSKVWHCRTTRSITSVSR